MDSSTYQQLRIFHAIARAGSISAAARILGITTPSASQALKLLEQKMDMPLFWRNTRRVILTDAGQRLLSQTGSLITQLEHNFNTLISEEHEPTGVVKITLSRFAYRLIIQPYLAEFNQLYPHICLDISIYDGTVDLVQAGYDFGIRFSDKIEENMVARQLLPSFQEGLYVSKDYLKKYGEPQRNNLHQHRLIGYRFITTGQILPLILEQNGESVSVEMPISVICNDIDAIADGMRAGLGIGRLFTPIYQQLPDKNNFIPILQSYWRNYPPVYLYYPQASQKIKRVAAVIKFLVDKMTDRVK
ncbi:LysR family transcriptional regulator [Avibacterium sp. 21-595]|uniref:LysR family transcriptional regulator n=1 Tax=Avibacterium sp. 21-595 TaxID=2911527 RepID=UPI002026B713|nr:LysR family transcriptional regulator [Avibacterium sp. 21-595]URL06330.1 LysR family transcriptional regulator [Avibacterium sp. 21-595]